MSKKTSNVFLDIPKHIPKCIFLKTDNAIFKNHNYYMLKFCKKKVPAFDKTAIRSRNFLQRSYQIIIEHFRVHS